MHGWTHLQSAATTAAAAAGAAAAATAVATTEKATAEEKEGHQYEAYHLSVTIYGNKLLQAFETSLCITRRR